ncbi:MAG: hypothetical protein ABI539_06715 [Acidobacteriota bacterium]
MNIRKALLAATLLGLFAAYALATGPAELAKQAVSEDASASGEAIRELRQSGPYGLDVLLNQFAGEIAEFTANGKKTDQWLRIARALDSVSMQKDSYSSGLYWYTDLDDAKAAAKKQNKPILSLRLLGNLNEEFSCANSRLFRSVLYPNAEIRKYLRDNYILHWLSVRPAPRITIDFGDGRKIERTITGNSIHYVLDENGTVIEALPGLYSPKGFLIYLTQAKQVNDRIDGLSPEKRDRALLGYRKLSFDRLAAQRSKAVVIAKVDLVEPGPAIITPVAPAANVKQTGPAFAISAITAAPAALTKMAVTDELSMLRVYDNFARFEPTIKLDDWNRLARVYSPGASLDAASNAFIRRQNLSTGLIESDFKKLFEKLERYIALDTTRNDLLFHTKLYEWLNREPRVEVEKLNDWVYADLFMTPASDKWLGLYSTDIYTALDGNGIIK